MSFFDDLWNSGKKLLNDSVEWLTGENSIIGSGGKTGWGGLGTTLTTITGNPLWLSTGYDIYNAERNYKSEQDAYNYQKELNQIQMDREDTAVQRRAADLRAAGLSQTLAAGSPASSSGAHAGTAPSYKMSAMDKFLTALTTEKIKNEVGIQSIDKIIRLQEARTAKANADYTEYETKRLIGSGRTKNESIITKEARDFATMMNDLGKWLEQKKLNIPLPYGKQLRFERRFK